MGEDFTANLTNAVGIYNVVETELILELCFTLIILANLDFVAITDLTSTLTGVVLTILANLIFRGKVRVMGGFIELSKLFCLSIAAKVVVSEILNGGYVRNLWVV